MAFAGMILQVIDSFGVRNIMPVATVLMQSTLMLCVAFVAVKLLRRYSAGVRFNIYSVTLLVLPLLPVVNKLADTVMAPSVSLPLAAAPLPRPALTMRHVPLQSSSPIAVPAPFASEPPDNSNQARTPVAAPVPDDVSFALSPMTYGLVVYLGGLVFMLLYLFVGMVRVRSWIRSGTPVTHSAIIRITEETVSNIGISRPVRIIESARISIPFVIGVWHPELVVPQGFAEDIEDAGLRSVVMHELMHVKRNDTFLIPLMAVVQALFWVHPLVWTMFRECRLLAETACDEMVVTDAGSSQRYARLLTQMAERAPKRPVLQGYTSGLFSGHVFRRRVKSIIDAGRNGARTMSRKLIAVSVMLAVMIFAAINTLQCTYTSAQTDMPDMFATADSLYSADQFVEAIDEYTHFLESDRADYALYMIGMCKTNIAKLAVTDYSYDAYPDDFRRRYDSSYQRNHSSYLNYAVAHSDEFPVYELGLEYRYQGAEFEKVLTDYPESDYVDDSAYQKLLISRHIGRGSSSSIFVVRINDCKAFLETYPESDFVDNVVTLCVDDYEVLLHINYNLDWRDISQYRRELEAFKRQWSYVTPYERAIPDLTGLELADSLYADGHWIQAIDEYTHLLDSEPADYMLYMIGMCKDNIANYTTSTGYFVQNANHFLKKYSGRLQEYFAFQEYIDNRPAEFRHFDPEGLYIFQGAEFRRILSEYPKSDYVDDSAYMLLVESLHSDWEGYVPIFAGFIERCKSFLEHYPTSEHTADVVERCVWYYENIITHGDDLTPAETNSYQRNLDAFKQEWGYGQEAEITVEYQASLATADSLYAADMWIQAIEEYTYFLTGERADYALYMIGLCKDAMATFTTSLNNYQQNSSYVRAEYGDNLEHFFDCLGYIRAHPVEFEYSDPDSHYVSNGAEFKQIITEYTDSEYVDDSAYMLVLQSRHGETEGYVPAILTLIDKCKAFLEQYPESEYVDEVVAFCMQDYEDILFSIFRFGLNENMTVADSLGFARDFDAFKLEWDYKKTAE